MDTYTLIEGDLSYPNLQWKPLNEITIVKSQTDNIKQQNLLFYQGFNKSDLVIWFMIT
jgi:hypothetical protein